MSQAAAASRPPVPPSSLWAATAVPARDYPPLDGAVKADVAIVGGGFTGLSAALHLAEKGVAAAVLDAAEPGWGASGRNGGQVIPGLKYDPDTLEARFGPDLGPRLVEAVGGTAGLVFSLIDRLKLDVPVSREGWIQPAHCRSSLETAHKRAAQWAARGAPVELLDREAAARLLGTDRYLGGWLDRRGGGIQPLSYARELARAAEERGARIHARSPAKGIRRAGQRWIVETETGSVEADTVLIATNGYTDGLWPELARTVVPVYSFQIASTPLSDNLRRSILPEGHVASDTRRLLLYFRLDHTGRFVMGGRAPYKEAQPDMADGQRLVRAVNRLFPHLSDVPFEFVWSGRVAMTQDHLPHLHELDRGVYAGLGFNGRGVGMGTLMGKFLADLALGTAPADIPFPVTAMSPMPLGALHRPAVMALTQYYRLRDTLESMTVR